MTLDLTTAAERARLVADDVLFPAAQHTDTADQVPRENLDSLRDAGLNGLQGPTDVPGGLGADHSAARPIAEAVAGGCGATAFVWAQHHGAVRRCAGGEGPARDVWLPKLCDGSVLAGIGFAYLRRPGPAAVRATAVGDGWRIDGEAPWITGWGRADVFVIMARAEDGSVVTVMVDQPYERSELTAGPPQRLAAMGSTGTVALRFDALVLGANSVIGVQTSEAWSLRDRVGSALPPAAPLGIADRAVRLLSDTDRPTPLLASTRSHLTDALEARRRAADEVAGVVASVSAGEADPVGLESAILRGALERERGLDLARRATDALVAASGGGAMALSHPAQRLSREATFYLIQAQTGSLREATLARVARDPYP
ncbi:MAG TPA: acyl-CoA dehydrogenase family protein [Actinomycetota bacterium]